MSLTIGKKAERDSNALDDFNH